MVQPTVNKPRSKGRVKRISAYLDGRSRMRFNERADSPFVCGRAELPRLGERAANRLREVGFERCEIRIDRRRRDVDARRSEIRDELRAERARDCLHVA